MHTNLNRAVFVWTDSPARVFGLYGGFHPGGHRGERGLEDRVKLREDLTCNTFQW